MTEKMIDDDKVQFSNPQNRLFLISLNEYRNIFIANYTKLFQLGDFTTAYAHYSGQTYSFELSTSYENLRLILVDSLFM